LEAGVWRGGATILMKGCLQAYGMEGTKVFVADSFEGLPKPNAPEYPKDRGGIILTISLVFPKKR
tara:strand:- start:39 stop:233 length:195 start_codon:yes stop_codon:yes gene_type:complete